MVALGAPQRIQPTLIPMSFAMIKTIAQRANFRQVFFLTLVPL